MVKLFSSPAWLLQILLLESDYVCLSIVIYWCTRTDSFDAEEIFIRIIDYKIAAYQSLLDFRDMKLGAALKKLILTSFAYILCKYRQNAMK